MERSENGMTNDDLMFWIGVGLAVFLTAAIAVLVSM